MVYLSEFMRWMKPPEEKRLDLSFQTRSDFAWKSFKAVYVRFKNGCLEISETKKFTLLWYVPCSDISRIELVDSPYCKRGRG